MLDQTAADPETAAEPETAHARDRIEDCRKLFLKYGGGRHEQIERDMRRLGHTDFHRRVLYRRYERGRATSGWIERFGWRKLLRNANRGSRGEDESVMASQHHTASDGHTTTNPRSAIRDPQSKDFGEFQAWLQRVSPNMTWTWKHQVLIYKQLKRVFDGLCKRLMIFVPPRHGKSELVTVRYAAWRLKQDPSMNVIIGSYNQRLANRFSRKIRLYLKNHRKLF